MRLFVSTALVVGMLTGLGLDAVAQQSAPNPSLPTLDSILNITVSGASLYSQSRTEAPAQVTVITAEEIAAFGYRSMVQVLHGVGGFNGWSDLQFNNLGVRGFGRSGDMNHRVLVLMDGHVLNESILGSAPMGTLLTFDVRSIERVEVIRGPGSPLYGTRAMLAVINVVTKRGRDMSGYEVSVEGGTFGSRGATIRVGGETRFGLEYSVAGALFETDGGDHYFPEFDAVGPADGIARGLDWESTSRAYASLRFEGAWLTAGFVSTEEGVPTAPFGSTFADPATMTDDSRALVELGYARGISSDVRISGRVYHDWNRSDGIYAFSIGDVENWISGANSGGEAHVQWDPSSGHRIVVGGQADWTYRANFGQGMLGGVPFFEDDSPYVVLSGFAQDEIQVTRDLAFTVGFRHDRWDASTHSTNPRAALVYHPTEGTTLKAMYGTAFRAPNVYERDAENPDRFRSNPSLVPEKIRTTELAAEQRLGPSLVAQVGIYESRMRDIIDHVAVDIAFDGFPILQFQNRSSVLARGVEAELSWSGWLGLRGHTRYSYQRGEDRDTGLRISNFPAHSLKAGAFGPLGADFGFGVDGVYESGRQTTIPGNYTDPFWVMNTTVTTPTVMGRFVLVGSVRNVFDDKYQLPAALHHVQAVIPQQGRRLFLELRMGS